MRGRLRTLDGLRGILALYILIGHTAPFLCLPASLGWLAAGLSHGRGAVELFFVLSGMVILRSLGAGTTRLTASQFLFARAGRLLPIYGAALTLGALALSWGNPFRAMPWLVGDRAAENIAEAGWPHPWLAHLAAHLTLTQGLFPPALLPDAEFAILGPAWSLSTEWQFYLVVAAILASRRYRHTYEDDWGTFLGAVMAIGMIGLLVDLLPVVWQPGRAFLPHEAWYFGLGIASHGLRVAGGRGCARLLWGLSFLALVTLAWQQSALTAAVAPVLWAACLVCETPGIPPLFRGPFRALAATLNARPLQWLGRISYPLYLIHMPVQRGLMLAIAPLSGGRWDLFTKLWGPAAIVAPVIVAYALHRWIELPCWQWSRERAARPLEFGNSLVRFFRKEQKALLFQKRPKNIHPFMDGG